MTIKAILLDLDNTLIVNNIENFIAAYLNSLNYYVRQKWSIADVSPALFRSIKKANTSPLNQMNIDVVYEELQKDAQLSLAQIQEDVADYYKYQYPDLKNCVQEKKEIKGLLESIHALKIPIVIATNPIFPLTAIKQRMQWGNLPEDLTYQLITNAENMHFTKPNPAYYAEILGKLGLEPDETLMVGDDLEQDILPAHQIGIHTFLLSDRNCPDTIGAHGTIAHLHNLIEKGGLRNLPHRQIKSEMIIPQLTGNLGALWGFIPKIEHHFWQQRPNPNEWSLLQILCHLWKAEIHTHRQRIIRILEEDNPFIVDQPPESVDSPDCHEDGKHVLECFTAERMKTIELLNTIPPEAWSRPARHSIFGLTNLMEMAYFTAQHDRLHLNQFCQTLGQCK
ncbi:hypothetical protein MASR2M15_23080 [Anaerolineales bacterium]